MNRVRKYANEEISEDMIIKILDFLPSKSLFKFKCVSKLWNKYIDDCRRRRWNQKPYLVGFFYQDPYIPLAISPIGFFFTSKNQVIDGTFDESLDNLFQGSRARIVAASNGFLLCIAKKFYYYVYNPATRQLLALPKTKICMEDNNPPIGFICMVDSPDKDFTSFNIVRYAIPKYCGDFQSTVTIESFSSETNVWTTNKIRLDVPLTLLHCTYMKSPSTSVIDGVFCWLDDTPKITVYDSIYKCFWVLKFPEDMENGKGCCHLSSTDGTLYFALNIRLEATIIVWYLASNIHSRDAVWVKKYVGNVGRTVLQCPEDFGLEGYDFFEVTSMAIHPTIPHIFYLGFLGKIISYDFEIDDAQLVYTCSWQTDHYKFFPYEWHQWPRLL